MTKRILVPIANGTEEIEAVTIIDTLTRAGYDVSVASADFDGQLTVTCSRGVVLSAQHRLVDIADEEFDAIVLPGGLGGAEVFQGSTILIEILKQQKYDGRLVAAICASPAIVLQHHDLYPGAIMTGHPNFQQHIPASLWRTRRVTFDINNNLLTSQGPGSSIEFAIEIIIRLSGKTAAKQVAEPMMVLPQLHYDKLSEDA
ncbi:DJ-1 family glyoxalase III [Vibrio palustris]|uniref:Chaperone protein YajL n=1 Tax=Vibrio palustris TaxID=1918946 RepID=A0A1R4AZV7_9VIBR|nr:DJ-1 family glyoxalase III [Vibrio palustris]SJL82198.1 Chaperone protein YajL [Vibrio palustris]